MLCTFKIYDPFYENETTQVRGRGKFKGDIDIFTVKLRDKYRDELGLSSNILIGSLIFTRDLDNDAPVVLEAVVDVRRGVRDVSHRDGVHPTLIAALDRS